MAKVSPNGNTLAVGYHMHRGTIFPAPSRVDRVSVVDPRTGKVTAVLKLRSPGFASTAVFSPVEPTVATWGSQGPIELWDARNGTRKGEIPAPDGPVSGAAFAPDGGMIAVVIGEHKVGMWDCTTGKLRWSIVPPGESVRECAFSPDGRTVACADGASQVCFVDTVSGKVRRTLTVAGGYIGPVTFSQNGKSVVISSADGGVRFWDSATGRLLITLRVFPPKHPRDLPSDWLAYTPDGYYTGSPEVGQFIRWRVGAKLLPAEAYARTYSRPDIVRAALEYRIDSPHAHP
jgi:WD40 repeat protein